MRFLDLDLRDDRFIGKDDIDPAIVALEIGAGLNDLNMEMVKLEMLGRAEEALAESIDLDEQIAAQGVANKATVTYGIESLAITATFLGVDIPVEEVAAGIEDNDQEGAASTKKGFLDKVVEGIKKVIKKIIEFVKKLVDKVKSFFESKQLENVAKKAEETAEKLEEKGVTEVKDCNLDDEDVEKAFFKVVKEVPEYLYAGGKLESIPDVEKMVNWYVDKEVVNFYKKLHEMIKNFNPKGAMGDLLKALKEAETGCNNNTEEKCKKNSEVSKQFKDLVAKTIKLAKDLDVKFTGINKFVVDELNGKAGKRLAKLEKQNGIKYKSILIPGSTTITADDKNRDEIKLRIQGTLYHIPSDIDAVAEEFENKKFSKEAVEKLLKLIKWQTEAIDKEFTISTEKLYKNVKPLSVKELMDYSKVTEFYREQASSIATDIKNISDKVKAEIEDIEEKLNTEMGKTGAGTKADIPILSNVKSIVQAVGDKTSTFTKDTGKVTKAISAYAELPKVCSKISLD